MSKELKELTETVAQLSELVTKLSFVVDPEAPAKAVTTVRRNAAGRLIDDKGRYLPEEAPKAKATKKAAPKAKKASPKAEVTTKALCKSTRKAFVKAVKAEQGIDLAGWSTLDIAASVLAGEVDAPEGFTIGEGYAKVVAERYDI